jgi:hypothetical protein
MGRSPTPNGQMSICPVRSDSDTRFLVCALPRVTFTIAREREIVPAVTHRRIHRQTRIGVRAEVRFVRTGIGSFAPGRPVQDYSLTGRGIAIASVSLCNRVVNMSEGRNVFVRPEEMHVRVVNRAAVGLLAKHTGP